MVHTKGDRRSSVPSGGEGASYLSRLPSPGTRKQPSLESFPRQEASPIRSAGQTFLVHPGNDHHPVPAGAPVQRAGALILAGGLPFVDVSLEVVATALAATCRSSPLPSSADVFALLCAGSVTVS